MPAPTPTDPLGESPVARQLAAGFPWLRFEPELEAEYRRYQYQSQRRQLRINLLIAVAIVAAIIQLDRMVLPAASGETMNLIRYGALLPALLGALAATFLPGSGLAYLRVVRVLAPVAVLAIVALVLVAWVHGDPRLFTALILATVFIYFLVGLPFYDSVATNLLALAAYAWGGHRLGMPADELTYNTMLILFSSLIGGSIMYGTSATRRRSWLERQLLDEHARRDGLTGIYNRRRFDEHLAGVWQLAVREQRPLMLMLADIDFFKAYNDRYGHQAGDEALKAVAAVLAGAARRPLDLVARYGGEEFAVLLYDSTREHGSEVAEQLMLGVRELRIPHGGSTVAPQLSVSIGVAYVTPVVGRRLEGLVQLADQALYRAKEGGRNRVHLLEAEYQQLQTGRFVRGQPAQ